MLCMSLRLRPSVNVALAQEEIQHIEVEHMPATQVERKAHTEAEQVMQLSNGINLDSNHMEFPTVGHNWISEAFCTLVSDTQRHEPGPSWAHVALVDGTPYPAQDLLQAAHVHQVHMQEPNVEVTQCTSSPMEVDGLPQVRALLTRRVPCPAGAVHMQEPIAVVTQDTTEVPLRGFDGLGVLMGTRKRRRLLRFFSLWRASRWLPDRA